MFLTKEKKKRNGLTNKVSINKEDFIPSDKQPKKLTRNSFSEPEKKNLIKIDTGKKVKNKKKSKKVRKKKLIIGSLIVLILLSIFSFFKIINPLLKIRDSVNNIRGIALQIQTDFDNKDISNLNVNIDQIQAEMDIINAELENFSYLKNLGITSGYYENLEVVNNIIVKSNLLIDDALPELTELLATSGFRTDPSQPLPTTPTINNNETTFITNSEVDSTELIAELEQSPKEDSSVNLIMSDLDKYINLYERLEPDIIDIFREFERLDTKYIPNVGTMDVKDRIIKLQELSKDFPEISAQTSNFLRKVPDLIGSKETVTYLLVLQNEAELRASGGLITVYGTLSITDGEMDSIALTDTWNLEHYNRLAIGVHTGPPDFASLDELPPYVSPFGYYQNIYGQAYLMNSFNNSCGVTSMRAQDVGLYPDLKLTAEIFSDYYDLANLYDPEEFPPYDHIIIADFAFAENLLGVLQPLEVEGFGTVTAESLFDFIKVDTDDPEKAFSPERKKIIEDIANAIGERVTELEIDESLNLAEIIIDSIYAKDIAFVSDDISLQTYFNTYGMQGEVEKNFDGDYFHLNEAQNCSLKINKYLRDTVTQNITINTDGSIDKTVQVNWSQEKVHEPELELQYDSDGDFMYRAWVRLFTPEGSENFESDGFRASGIHYYQPYEYYDEVVEKEVSENVIRFDHRRLTVDDPIATQSLEVSYSLPRDINYQDDGLYKMLIQKHPGKSWGEEYTININDNGVNYSTKFILDRDKVVTYMNGQIFVENYQTELDWLKKLLKNLPITEE